jgi:hypothetical protein
LERSEHSSSPLIKLPLDRLEAAVAGDLAARHTAIPIGSGSVDNAALATATGQSAMRLLGRRPNQPPANAAKAETEVRIELEQPPAQDEQRKSVAAARRLLLCRERDRAVVPVDVIQIGAKGRREADPTARRNMRAPT